MTDRTYTAVLAGLLYRASLTTAAELFDDQIDRDIAVVTRYNTWADDHGLDAVQPRGLSRRRDEKGLDGDGVRRRDERLTALTHVNRDPTMTPAGGEVQMPAESPLRVIEPAPDTDA
jgi:hypothetical protein